VTASMMLRRRASLSSGVALLGLVTAEA